MAAFRLTAHSALLDGPPLHENSPAPPHHSKPSRLSFLTSRRAVLLISIMPLGLTALPRPSHARERRTMKRSIPPDEYMTSGQSLATGSSLEYTCLGLGGLFSISCCYGRRWWTLWEEEGWKRAHNISDGLKYYDLIEGKGPVAVKGSTVMVHFDCIYRGVTAVSSRESKLLAGNRSIAQPYEFTVGSTPGKERKREYVDNANGLFSAQAAPKPPPALYSITEGMKIGGKRTVIVPPEVGFGQRGMNEIPPGATFELNVELLQVLPSTGK